MISELDTQKAAKLLVRFNLQPVKDEAASIEQGRPIFKDVEYIEIRVPGDRDTVHRPLRESDKQEFAQHYAAWKANAEGGGMIGTPLSEMPGIAKSQVLELEYFGCRTVEQLAGMSDGNLKNVGPILDLRKKAQLYLEAAKGNAPLDKMQAELKARDNEIDLLKKQMAELLARDSKNKAQKST